VLVADASLALFGVVAITTVLAFVFARAPARATLGDAIEVAALNLLVVGLIAIAALRVFT
jgi:hypothetical protein